VDSPCIGDLIEVACFSSLASMYHVVTHLFSILVGEMYKVTHVRMKISPCSVFLTPLFRYRPMCAEICCSLGINSIVHYTF
jgi:hypothetical protein